MHYFSAWVKIVQYLYDFHDMKLIILLNHCQAIFFLINSIMSLGVIRVGDFHFGHFCLGTGTGFHATPFVIPGSTSVIVNGRYVCTMGSITLCKDKIVTGNPTVLVGGKPIARQFDLTSGHSCNEAIETETTVPTNTGGTVTVKSTDRTCELDGGYYHPSACATGSPNVFA